MATRQKFIDAAFQYLGVRWQDEGRSKRGIDCVGLIICAGWECGLVDRDTDYRGYLRMPTGFNFHENFERHMRRKRLADRKPGDVLLHREGVAPCHSSILFDRPGYGEMIIHASMPRKSVTTDMLAGAWMGQTYGFCYEFNFED